MTDLESLRAVLDKYHDCEDADPEILRELYGALATALERLEAAERAIDAMMREAGSEPDSRYARNACIIGAAALAAQEGTRT